MISLLFLTGVSFYFVILLITGQHKWVYISAIPGGIRRVGRISITELRNLPYLGNQFKKHSLPVYDLIIDKEDLDFLNNNLPKAQNLLSDEHKIYVDAKIVYYGEEHPVKVRYRGDNQNHWLWDKKSFRLKFKESFYGGKSILNLITPRDRGFIVEELNYYRARKLGLMVPDSRFVVLRINGKEPRVYWEVEQLSKDSLERYGWSGDTNLYKSRDLIGSIYSNKFYWDKRISDMRTHSNDTTDISSLLRLLENPSDEYFNKNIFSILDADSFYHWSVHKKLSFNDYQNWTHNANFYFSPSLGKFLFIPWDVNIGPAPTNSDFVTKIEKGSNALENRILNNPVFMGERNRRLWDYVSGEYGLEDDLRYYDRVYKDIQVPFYQDHIKHMTHVRFDSDVKNARNLIIANISFWKGLFKNVLIEPVVSIKEGEISIKLGHKSLAPLLVESFEIDVDDYIDIVDKSGLVVCKSGDEYQNVVCDVEQVILNPHIVKHQDVSHPHEYAFDLTCYQFFVLEKQTNRFVLHSNAVSLEDKIKRVVLNVKNIYTGESKKYEADFR